MNGVQASLRGTMTLFALNGVILSNVRYLNYPPAGPCHEYRTANTNTDGHIEVWWRACEGASCNVCRPTVWHRLLYKPPC